MLENTQNNTQLGVAEQKGVTQIKTIVAPLRESPRNSEKRSIRRLGKYQFSTDQRIGSGMTGDAYVGINTENFELVCVKAVDRQVFKTDEQKKLLDNEIRCQQACNSNFTIKIFDIFDTTSFCFIVTEFCEGGDLYRCLKASKGGLPEPIVLRYAHEIAKALKKLKDAGIVHRDIKSENILIHKNHCKLGDFGFAIEQKKLVDCKKFNLGSPLYMSIQALEHSSYSLASDVFSYGVVLYEMLHQESPWECSDQQQLLAKMKKEDAVFKSNISEKLKQLIQSCLQRQPGERPTIEQILSNDLFVGIEGLPC